VPVGPFDVELGKLISVNRHEGLRLGFGSHTNDKFSGILQVGGYFAYGFKDRAWKYGGKARIEINRFHEAHINLFYNKDVDEAGADDPFEDRQNLFDPDQFRLYLVQTMDQSEMQRVSVSRRIFNYAMVEAFFSRKFIKPLYEYGYVTHRQEGILVSSSEFSFTEASVSIRYAYGEKFLKNTRSIISMGTSYPTVWFFFGRGINGLAGGQYEYNRFSIKVKKIFSSKYLGKTSFTLLSGMIDRTCPIPVSSMHWATMHPFPSIPKTALPPCG